MNISTNRAQVTVSQQRTQAQTSPQQPQLSDFYGNDQVILGESNRGLAENLLLADCLGEAACSGMDNICDTFGMGTGGY